MQIKLNSVIFMCLNW